MAKFRFRLESLRKLRISHRDELRAKLAEAYQAVQVLEEQRQVVTREITELQESQRKAALRQTTEVNRLLEAQRYQSVLKSQLDTMRQQTQQLETEIEKRRQLVVDADREVRVLDKLEERKRQQFHLEAMIQETKVLDEIATTRWEADN